MIKKLLLLVIIAFAAGILFTLLFNQKLKIALKDSKNCISIINACTRNGICGPQIVKIC